jgi:polysaccharide biosynthesis transport protein
MELDNRFDEESPLRHYLRVLRRRKWSFVQPIVLVPALAVLYSLSQSHLYQASAKVLLLRQNLASTLNGNISPDVYQDPVRLAETQVEIARVPALAQRTLRANGLNHRTPEQFLRSSHVSADQNADILEFRVTDRRRDLAMKLATSYAREYTAYRRGLDSLAVHRAANDLRDRLRLLRNAGDSQSPLYSSLANKEQQLRTNAALGSSNSVFLRPADTAKQVQPRPLRAGVLGGILGLLLGVAFVGLREAIDTRVRSGEEVGQGLGLPLLGRLPSPSRRMQRKHELVMLSKLDSVQAEAFRMLRTNLEFAMVAKRPRTLMVTSALEFEGKTTTVANLAVALGRAGRRIVLVDLDLRRPGVNTLFHLEPRPGLTDVAIGQVELLDALVPLPISAEEPDQFSRRNGREHMGGTVEVLPAGSVPPNPGEFAGTENVSEILGKLQARADLVLIDAPPILHAGDAMALSRSVDAIMVVARLNTISRSALRELRRILEACPAAKLGFVLTNATRDESLPYRGYYGRSAPAQKEALTESPAR